MGVARPVITPDGSAKNVIQRDILENDRTARRDVPPEERKADEKIYVFKRPENADLISRQKSSMKNFKN